MITRVSQIVFKDIFPVCFGNYDKTKSACCNCIRGRLNPDIEPYLLKTEAFIKKHRRDKLILEVATSFDCKLGTDADIKKFVKRYMICSQRKVAVVIGGY